MASVLDTAGHVDVEDVSVRHQSDHLGGIIVYGDASPWSILRRWRLRWPVCTDAQKRGVWEHFRETVGSFEYGAPDGETYDVIYEGAPQFGRESAASGSLQVTLREAKVVD